MREMMDYFVKRGDQQYGPYPLADLQLFIRQGHIALTDLARSEAMEEWLTVSQIAGNITVAETSATGFGAITSGAAVAPARNGNAPPGLHWGVLLALSIVTCTLFGVVWGFVEAAHVRKIRPQSNALLYLGLHLAALVGAPMLEVVNKDLAKLAPLLNIGGWIFLLSAVFSMRSSLEDYYNSEENIGLRLSGVMTFFFGLYYFQYHFNRINQWRSTGVLQPQN